MTAKALGVAVAWFWISTAGLVVLRLTEPVYGEVWAWLITVALVVVPAGTHLEGLGDTARGWVRHGWRGAHAEDA